MHMTLLPIEVHGQTSSNSTTTINTTNAKSLTTQLTNVAIVSAANSTASNVVTHTISASLPATNSKQVKETETPITTAATATAKATTITTTCIIVKDKQETIVDPTAMSSATRKNANNVAPSVVLSPKQRNDGNENNVSTLIKTNEGSKTAFATVASTTTESKYTELKAISSSVVSEFASDASLNRYENEIVLLLFSVKLSFVKC